MTQTCTAVNVDGEKCGADLPESSWRGTFVRNGVLHRKYTCAAGHKRVVWINAEGCRCQEHMGRTFGTNNKTVSVHVRTHPETAARILTAGWTYQQWWDYCASLDMPAR